MNFRTNINAHSFLIEEFIFYFKTQCPSALEVNNVTSDLNDFLKGYRSSHLGVLENCPGTVATLNETLKSLWLNVDQPSREVYHILAMKEVIESLLGNRYQSLNEQNQWFIFIRIFFEWLIFYIYFKPSNEILLVSKAFHRKKEMYAKLT